METFGIELEVSNLGTHEAQRLLNRAGLEWVAKMDGTHMVSAEAVSPILNAERLNESKRATRALLSGGATVNRQTGYHVHLGADEYGAEAIAHLVWNWNWAHATIGALVAKSRLNNHFCRPVSTSMLTAWFERVRGGEISNAESGRYFSLNLNSYQRHGTVEFRLHHGTLNGSKVKAWAEFVSAMARYSVNGENLTDSRWQSVENRLNNVRDLLDLLTVQAGLNTETAEYLKTRADELARA